MLKCWSFTASERPSFHHLLQQLQACRERCKESNNEVPEAGRPTVHKRARCIVLVLPDSNRIYQCMYLCLPCSYHCGSQQTKYVDPMLVLCWARVCNANPTLKQHCVNISCLLGCEARIIMTESSLSNVKFAFTNLRSPLFHINIYI